MAVIPVDGTKPWTLFQGSANPLAAGGSRIVWREENLNNTPTPIHLVDLADPGCEEIVAPKAKWLTVSNDRKTLLYNADTDAFIQPLP